MRINAGEKPHARGAAPRQEPEAVVLYLAYPMPADRRSLGRAWQVSSTKSAKDRKRHSMALHEMCGGKNRVGMKTMRVRAWLLG
jgi:hypothetical protein